MFYAILTRELSNTLRKKYNILFNIILFVLISTLIAWTGEQYNQSNTLNILVNLFIILIIITIVSSNTLYSEDERIGYVDQMRCLRVSGYYIVSKTFSCWIGLGLPLAAATQISAVVAGLGEEGAARLAISYLLASPALIALCGLGAIAGLRARYGSNFSWILLLPLQVPLMVFGLSFLMEQQGAQHSAALQMLVALNLVYVPITLALTSAITKNLG